MLYLAIATVIPAILTIILLKLEKTDKIKDMPYAAKQITVGIIFGIYAIGCTEFGVDINGAVINVRDTAPIVAGLVFGGPAGIIAGLIGGVERWFSVYWGGGEVTRIACSLATVIAGFTAANLRKIMFKKQRPSSNFAVAIALGTEVLHMLLVLLTNMDNMSVAFEFVQKCTAPMIICNVIATFLAVIPARKINFKVEKPRRIVKSFLNALFICVFILFAITCSITYAINTSICKSEAKSMLSSNLTDVTQEIERNGVTDRISHWRTGQSGGVLLCDKSGNLLVASKEGEPIEVEDYSNLYGELKASLKENTFYKTEINGETMYCEYRAYSDYYVFTYMSADEADLSSNVTLYMILFMETLIYITVFCLVYQITRIKFIEKIEQINEGLEEIVQGNLDTKLNVRSSYEFSHLSDDINSTVDTLKNYISEAKNRIEQELKLSRQIQKSAVPFIFPPFPKRDDFEIYALMNTAKEVGGDFYDFYFTDNNHFAFLIADVSGKGIPAAMFMMASKTLIKSLAESGKTVDTIFNETNEKLCRSNDAGMFVTAWMGVVNLETGHMAFANAGHNPPLICRKNGNFEYLKTKPNFILAGMDCTVYQKYELWLNPGDEIYLYTDGVTEANDVNGKLFGDNRLLKSMQNLNGASPEIICKQIESDVNTFAKDAEQSDDMTMLSFRLNYMKNTNSITVYPDSKALERINDYICKMLKEINVSKSVLNKISVIIDEIYSNILKYSFATKLTVSYSLQNEQLLLTFADNGKPYDPTESKVPDIALSAEEREIGGLGIFMVRNMSSSIDYKYENAENILNITVELK